jgi:NhaP-type Na+/H+ or K+/H+ antiporter
MQVCMAHLSRLLGKIAETVVFAYLGMSAFIGNHTWHLGFTLTTIVAILIGRALNVFPIAWLLNRRARLQLSWQEQAVMWFSGLRGAISYCLATNAPSASLLAPCTLAVVLITTIFFGGGTMPFVRYLICCACASKLFERAVQVHGSRGAQPQLVSAEQRRRRSHCYQP